MPVMKLLVMMMLLVMLKVMLTQMLMLMLMLMWMLLPMVLLLLLPPPSSVPAPGGRPRRYKHRWAGFNGRRGPVGGCGGGQTTRAKHIDPETLI